MLVANTLAANLLDSRIGRIGILGCGIINTNKNDGGIVMKDYKDCKDYRDCKDYKDCKDYRDCKDYEGKRNYRFECGKCSGGIFDEDLSALNALIYPVSGGRIAFSKGVKGMKTDIEENDKETIFNIEVPGFNKEEIEISVDDGYLIVSAKKETEETTYSKKESDENICSKKETEECSCSAKRETEEGSCSGRNEAEKCGGKNRILRRERFFGSTTRSFYVGDVDEDSIKARLDKGILTVIVPKEEKKVPEKKHVTIE